MSRVIYNGTGMSKTALEIKHLHAWQNQTPIIKDLNLSAKQGEMIAFVSSCKTTQLSLLDSLLGINPDRKGSIRIHQTEAIHLTASSVPLLGMALCSKDTCLDLTLTCEENLLMPLNGYSLGGGLPLTEIYLLFPRLAQYKDFPCTNLSPGAQQLLALARVLRNGADIIVLHDFYEDLCPSMRHITLSLFKKLKQREYTIILNESDKSFAASLADQLYCIKNAKAQLYTLPSHLKQRLN